MGILRKRQQLPVRSPRDHARSESQAFRRSRTLTGSVSEDVRSVGEDRAQMKSPRLKEHELRSHRRKLSGYLVGVVIVVALLSVLLSQFRGIVTINIQSDQPLMRTVDQRRYLSVINEYFAARPVERFRFALNESGLMDYMSGRIPEVAEITFEQTGLVTATAEVRFRVPVVAWQQQTDVSYVDGEGRSFTMNYYREPAVTVRDESGLSPASGTVISERFLYFMGRVIALTDASGVTRVTGATIPRDYSREIDFLLEGRGYAVKTQFGRDPASQAADIVNAVRYIDSNAITPAYVDVRISGKAAYR